jgi:hypothetical protein
LVFFAASSDPVGGDVSFLRFPGGSDIESCGLSLAGDKISGLEGQEDSRDPVAASETYIFEPAAATKSFLPAFAHSKHKMRCIGCW